MICGAAGRYGTIAQLGEHLLDVERVTGSSPAGSILGHWRSWERVALAVRRS